MTLVYDTDDSMVVHWDPTLSNSATTLYRVEASVTPTFATIVFDQSVPASASIDAAFRARPFDNVSYAGDGYTISSPVDPWYTGYSVRFPVVFGVRYYARVFGFYQQWGPPALSLPRSIPAGPVRVVDIARGAIVSTRGDRFVASLVQVGAGRHAAALSVTAVLGNSTVATNTRNYNAFMCSLNVDGIHIACDLQEGVGCCYRLYVVLGTRAALLSPWNATVSFGPPVVLGFQWDSILVDPQYSVVLKVCCIVSNIVLCTS